MYGVRYPNPNNVDRQQQRPHMLSQNQQLVATQSPYGMREGGCQDDSDDHQYTDDDEWKPCLQERTDTEKSAGGERPVGWGGGGGGGGGGGSVGSMGSGEGEVG